MDFPILDLIKQDRLPQALNLLHPGGFACPLCAPGQLDVIAIAPSLQSSTTTAKAFARSSTCLPAPLGKVHTSGPANPLDPPGHRRGLVSINSPGSTRRDDDGDGVREVHCNTMEGIWTGLWNFLRPFRGVNKEYLEQYIIIFQWSYNLKAVTDVLPAALARMFSGHRIRYMSQVYNAAVFPAVRLV